MKQINLADDTTALGEDFVLKCAKEGAVKELFVRDNYIRKTSILRIKRST